MPPFVARDVSGRLQDLLQVEEFVLIIGESTAGKTRAAYEAMTAVLGDHVLVEPQNRDGLAAALDAAQNSRQPCVVWLDDLERFLGTGGLTRADVRALVEGGRHRNTILATMRTEEHARFLHSGHHSADRLGAETRAQGEDVIRLAHQIHLARRWSAAEVGRLRAHDADPRLSEALAHAEAFGVSEYLSAGPQLLGAWQAAWAPGTHPRGAALVAAGVLARRSGMHRHLTAQQLADAAEAYLEARGGALLRPEPLADAVAWATTPLFATSSLLLPDGQGGLRAFDYLIDALPKEPPPAAAVAALVAVSTPDEAIDLGELADGWELLDVAEEAYRRALNHHPDAARRRRALSGVSYVILERDGAPAALRFASDLAREYETRLGTMDPDSLDARSLEAWNFHHRGDSARALALVESLRTAIGSAPGMDEQLSLALRRGAAVFHAALGNHAEAARLSSDLAQDWEAYAGPDSPSVTHSMVLHAQHAGDAQGPGHAYANLQALMDDARFRPGTRAHRELVSQVAYRRVAAGDYAGAARSFAAQAEAWAQEVGAGHTTVLFLRYELADCLGRDGDPVEAVRILHDVVHEYETLTAADPRLGLTLRTRLAIWIGRAGDPHDALQRLRRLAETSRTARGVDDPRTLSIRRHAAYWAAEAGDVPRALAEARQLLADCERVLGPTADLTTEVRDQHDEWERTLAQAT
ncbi:hypothetical protein [Yinghuangia soli]|uniref:Tetratricopeptide repeat protein n=1 Tax=Yinghuangia soli TaxID=2908204 RepID=A0AA41PV34_9ACTN|nr:hypothetical protein [Yinghuangia soli]MCF2525875.1 hypothetical protein [Yinghuangia soli]